MKKYLLVAAASVAFASPAAARDGAGYIGVEGGLLFPQHSKVDASVTDQDNNSLGGNNVFSIEYKSSYDLDALAGYDFGRFRVEGELGYKRAGLQDIRLNQAVVEAIAQETGVTVGQKLDIDGHTTVVSGMANALVDLGSPSSGFTAFAGAGAGLASVKFTTLGSSDSDSAFAWQLMAGIRQAITPSLDLGVKYRYFRTGKLNYSQQFDVDGDVFTGRLAGHFTSHSLLASVVYNFGVSAPPPMR